MSKTSSDRPSLPADFGFGEDEALLQELAKRFLDEQLPVERLRNLVAAAPEPVYDDGELPSWDAGMWKQIVELGWSGLAVPESAGGAGFSLAGIAGLLQEVGRHALPSPLPSTICTSFVLRELEGDVAAGALSAIADGRAASLAITGAAGEFEPGVCDALARPEGDGFVLSGRACFVQDAMKAESLLISARAGEALVLGFLPVDAPGLRIEA
ncbi:MAG: acyl-CoA dehydrogenase family protein, partial [Myxococcota bacterium]|nr:acyl-CoA dehydrogenase family protein [Myxococcota bacterium]